MKKATKYFVALLAAAGLALLQGGFSGPETFAATPSNAEPQDSGVQEREHSMGTPTSRNPIQVGEENTLTLEIYDPNITDILDIEWYIEDPSIADFKTMPSVHDRSITVVAKKNGTTTAGAKITYEFLGSLRTRTTSSRIYVGERTSNFTMSITKRSFPVGDTSTYTLLVRNSEKVESIDEIRWDITDTSIVDFTKTPGVADQSVTVKGLKEGESHIYAEVVYNGGQKERYGNGITVKASSGGGSSSGSSSSGGSSGGSGGDSGSSSSSGSSSRSSKAAQAAAPLPAVTPIVTDNSGVSRFGNAIIAQAPQNYTDADRTLLITSGTWSQTSNGYWQLNGTNAGNLRGRWALVSDALSQNPAGSASWFYFDNNGYAASGWQWIAGMDGVYRCYYFNQEAGSLFGACLLNGITPDGYEVDATGAWTQNGTVMTKTAN